MGFRIAFMVLVAMAAVVEVTPSTDKIVCYLGSWSIYTPGDAKFSIEDFDPWLCTHINYAFVGLKKEDGSVYVTDEYSDIELGGFKKVNDLKRTNPDLKTLISIGGFFQASQTFSEVAGNAAKRAKFIETAMGLIGQYGFNGIDLDWEYPVQDGPEADRANFVTLLREFREECNRHGYLLTIAAGANREVVATSYDVQAVSDLVDFINVMTYDFHGQWNTVTGENSPLYSEDVYNVVDGIGQWTSRGVDPGKLNVGLGFYGHSFTLKNPSQHGIGAPSTGPGAPGPVTETTGEMDYFEICALVNDGGWTEEWSEEQQVPYAYKGDQWVGYDNPTSIRKKVEFAEAEKLAGVMIWAIGGDDLRGNCGGGRYTLLTTIHDRFYPGSKRARSATGELI